MSESFSVPDPRSLSDLRVYLSRAGRIEDGSIRIVAGSGVLAVYCAILYPRGLLDHTPTVLGLRTFATDPAAAFDAVVPSRSMLDRLIRLENAGHAEAAEIAVTLPLQVSTVTWAGISPPRGGWYSVGEIAVGVLSAAAAAGIEEIATTVPAETGEPLARHTRAEVWSRPLSRLDYVPAGAAFAAFSLGFLADATEVVTVFETGPWTRLTLRRGHVLVRRPDWSLQG
ncbi:MAG: hypothetical protein ABI255_05605 [Microbacteriaceae bacterium]